jgi:hypothetical protein
VAGRSVRHRDHGKRQHGVHVVRWLEHLVQFIVW